MSCSNSVFSGGTVNRVVVDVPRFWFMMERLNSPAFGTTIAYFPSASLVPVTGDWSGIAEPNTHSATPGTVRSRAAPA
jgi:hypothetical protein